MLLSVAELEQTSFSFHGRDFNFLCSVKEAKRGEQAGSCSVLHPVCRKDCWEREASSLDPPAAEHHCVSVKGELFFASFGHFSSKHGASVKIIPKTC